MASSAPLSSNLYQFDLKHDGEVVVHTIEKMSIDNAASLLKKLRRLVKTKSPSALTIDLNSLAYIDDFGAQVLFELRDLLSSQDRKLHIVNTPPHADDIISRMFFDLDECVIYKRKRSLNIIGRLGEASLRYMYNVRFMVSPRFVRKLSSDPNHGGPVDDGPPTRTSLVVQSCPLPP